MLFAMLLVSLGLGGIELKRPHITVAQGYVESNMNPKAVGAQGEKGAWQIKEEYWGKVPRTLDKQALHAEQVLDKILKENDGNIRVSLARYNGRGKKSRMYANKVMSKALELATMDMPERSKIDLLHCELVM